MAPSAILPSCAGNPKRVWINGASLTEVAATNILFDSMPLTLGADLDNGVQGSPVRGTLDDVRIYNRALTTSELALLAAMGS